MSFRLVDAAWDKEFRDAVREDHSELRIVSPFIKARAAQRLLEAGQPGMLQVITRFDLRDFCDGVSDLAALRLLLENGAAIRGVRNLHAKLYIFGDKRVIVTSANLTELALLRNHEFGIVTDDATIVRKCRCYFEGLWKRAGPDLVDERLEKWETTITDGLVSGAQPTLIPILGDQGVDAGIVPEPSTMPPLVSDSRQAFVKFFGTNTNRADRSMPVFDEVQRSGSHRACTYPKGKRPRQVEDGAIMFMGRMVREPHDIIIYGRAIGIAHVPERDDATAADIKLRPWKEKWPRYIRVHHAEFIAGTLANGISLNELMDTFQSHAFRATQRNAVNGTGNTDPRHAYRQQAAVELTAEAATWLNEQLEVAYSKRGRLPRASLAQLDWPDTH